MKSCWMECHCSMFQPASWPCPLPLYSFSVHLPTVNLIGIQWPQSMLSLRWVFLPSFLFLKKDFHTVVLKGSFKYQTSHACLHYNRLCSFWRWKPEEWQKANVSGTTPQQGRWKALNWRIWELKHGTLPNCRWTCLCFHPPTCSIWLCYLMPFQSLLALNNVFSKLKHRFIECIKMTSQGP